ncbi:MAG: hypothetical protein GX674_01375 [Clostridiales bacterium]|nr:hypothetical protein [Clostridiales bacterium]
MLQEDKMLFFIQKSGKISKESLEEEFGSSWEATYRTLRDKYMIKATSRYIPEGDRTGFTDLSGNVDLTSKGEAKLKDYVDEQKQKIIEQYRKVNMKDLVLTDAGNRILRALYKEYKRRKKAKQREVSARYFGDENELQQLLFSDDDASEIGNACWYLCRKGLLDVSPGDDMANEISFTDDGIAYMENSVTRKSEHGIDLLGKLKP